MTIDIAKARALCEAATQGDWSANGCTVTSLASVAWCGASSCYVVGGDSQVIDDKQAGRNAAFIAAARTLLPEALGEIERLTTLANANAQKCHDLADAFATEQRLAVHAEQKFAESQVKLAAAQAALSDATDRTEHYGRTRLAAPCTNACETSRRGDDRYLSCDKHRADIADDRCADGVDGGDGCLRCELQDAIADGTQALDATLSKAREDGAAAMRDAAVKVCRDADVIRSGGFYDADLGQATLDAAADAIAALPTNGGK